jgi:NitT/TauT family transport system substrate-binding protein
MSKDGLLVSLVVFLLVATLAVGCTVPPLAPADDGQLKVGVLGILDTLPMYVAEQEGYFKSQGIAVELVPFKSALERDTAMQAGQLDGMLNDLVSAALLNKDADKVRVVRVAMRPAPGNAMFRLLAAPQTKAQTVSDLRGMEIGISKSTVIEYVTDSLVTAGGLQPADVAYSPVPDIALRLSSLVEGRLAAATLPEPMASLAVKQGARPLADDSQLTVGQSVLTFGLEAIQKKPATLRKFLAAYEDGVRALNATPAKYNSLLIDKGRVPEPVKDSFAMPPFPTASVPTESEVSAVAAWMVRKGLLTKAVSYAMLVDGTFLPGK